MAIVLSGVAVSSFIGAMTDTVLTLKPDTAIQRTAFLIGGLSGKKAFITSKSINRKVMKAFLLTWLFSQHRKQKGKQIIKMKQK